MVTLSLSARREQFQEQSGDGAIVLCILQHPSWGVGGDFVYLCSDPVERLTTDPLAYGVRSYWRGRFGQMLDPVQSDFLHVLMSVQLPDKSSAEPPSASLIFENVVSDMGRTITDLPVTERRLLSADLAVVMQSTPDIPEEEYWDLRCLAGPISEDRISVTFSRAPIVSEPCPVGRMTASRFPGLFR